MFDLSRRGFVKASGAAIGGLALGTTPGAAISRPEDRFIVDMDTTSMGEMGTVEVIHDLRDEIGYVVVACSDSEIPDSATYMADMEIELEAPAAERDSGLNANDDIEDSLSDLQWDKRDQNVGRVHDDATGEGARIGVLDDGVLGANPKDDFSHPDLPNVREDLSFDFTNDGNGPGPLNDDHGTHVAGTAAAADGGAGVVGVAPDAEVVDLRVFSGVGAITGDIIAALVVGAAPEEATLTVTIGNTEEETTETVEVSGADCDVLNCSFGVPPLVPVDDPDSSPVSGVGPYVPVLPSVIAFFENVYRAAASFALDNGTLPVASAGNSGVNLSQPVSDDSQAPGNRVEGVDAVPSTYPAEAPGFMAVGATGPIGFGWPFGNNPDQVGTLPLERPIQTELTPAEPAFYTNYGADAVDVTAGGGNADIDAIDELVGVYDLVFSTGIENLVPSQPEDARLDTYTPGYVWKAGTSFSAPNVSGLAALLFGADPEADPGEVRATIEDTARPRPVGRAGQTTAPSAASNVATDGAADGDTPSNPGSNPQTLSVEAYRGAGHVDVAAAVAEFTGGDGGGDSGNGRGKGRQNGRGR